VLFRLGEPSKAFTTYFHYVSNLAEYLKQSHGTDSAERYGNVFDLTLACSSAISQRMVGEADASRARQHLGWSWSNLVCLHRDASSEDFFEAKNAWTPAEAWYSVHHAFCSLRAISQSASNSTHEATARHAAQLIAQQKALPYPWNAYITSTHNRGEIVQYHGFQREPKEINTLARTSTDTFEDRYALMLKTTATRRAEDKLKKRRASKVRIGRTRRNVLREEKRTVYEQLGPTTLYDLLYRLRRRANYGDVDTFVTGSSSLPDARKFAHSLEVITDCTVATIEALLSLYMGNDGYKGILTSYAKRHRGSDILSSRLRHHQQV
jgi:hypothetical protein